MPRQMNIIIFIVGLIFKIYWLFIASILSFFVIVGLYLLLSDFKEKKYNSDLNKYMAILNTSIEKFPYKRFPMAFSYNLPLFIRIHSYYNKLKIKINCFC